MIDAACDGTNAIDEIIVHSFSRFMRDSFAFEFYARKLAKSGVRLRSITQDVSDHDPAQVMMRKIIALFDEYQSKENAKHVLRSMKENARQGFWNGSTPPYGYAAKEIERRGARIKKRLAVDAVEAELVRLVFRLYLEGCEGGGPMGVKAITAWLNEHGYRTRKGATWGIGPIHTMLTNPAYIGRMRFNRRDSRLGQRKPDSEHVTFDVPLIIDPPYFERVQSTLKSRNPRVTPPREVSGPILLTGLAVCATCDGGMTLRTGTSQTGTLYRYYSCSKCAREGKSVCKGRSIRMDKLDHLVTHQLLDRLLTPERLAHILSLLAERRAARAVAVDDRIKGLAARASEAEDRLRRLYKLVEDGLAEADDILKARLMALKIERDASKAALDRARGTNRKPLEISTEHLEEFGHVMREHLTTGDIQFRKAYLGAIIDKVEVDDHQIRILGRKDVLEHAVISSAGGLPIVRSFVRKWWRTRRDSNS
jgi:site-specific DNA recombinase